MELNKLGTITPSIQINKEDLRKCIHYLRAVDNRFRQRIIEMLKELDEATANQISTELNLEKNIVTGHLAILLRHNIITSLKISSTKLVYCPNREMLNRIAKFVYELNHA